MARVHWVLFSTLHKRDETQQLSTCDLADDGLGDPAVVEKGFDLLFHQVAVSPV